MTEQGNEPRDEQAVGAERPLQEKSAEGLIIADQAQEAIAIEQPHSGVVVEEPAAVAEEEEGEEETWTNQPKELLDEQSGLVIDGNAADQEGEDDFDEESLEDQEEAPAPKRSIRDARDVLMYELVARAGQAKLRLKPYLAGTIGVEFSNSGEQFLLDWRGEELKVSSAPEKLSLEVAEGAVSSGKVDCIISMTENNLMAVRSGDLNPQVAMIADKIKVRGKVTPAVYLFNLIAPRNA
jgi:hypothetical protein